VFGGRVELLIPLYAIGVFTSITCRRREWSATGFANAAPAGGPARRST
jgi:hypothetical protein